MKEIKMLKELLDEKMKKNRILERENMNLKDQIEKLKNDNLSLRASRLTMIERKEIDGDLIINLKKELEETKDKLYMKQSSKESKGNFDTWIKKVWRKKNERR